MTDFSCPEEEAMAEQEYFAPQTLNEPTHNHLTRQFYGRDKTVVLPGEAKDCPDCRPQEWVKQLLSQYVVPAGSVVVMANINDLAAVLVEELCLDEWFETWGDPPQWLT